MAVSLEDLENLFYGRTPPNDVDIRAALRPWKNPVRVATTAAGTLATSFEAGQTIDGVVLAENDRILIKNQASGVENGIYNVSATGAPSRASDLENTRDAAMIFVPVIEGTTNGETLWYCSDASGAADVGTDALTFAQWYAGEADCCVTVNGTGSSGAGYDLDNSTPAAPAGAANVAWQVDVSTPINVSGYIAAASDTVPGVVELATDAEAQAGTATNRAMTPANVAALGLGNQVINLSAGSAAAPSLEIASEIGIYRPSLNTMALTVDKSTNAATISNTSVALSATGSLGAAALSLRNEAATGVYSPASQQVGLTANSKGIFLDASGANPILYPDQDSNMDLGASAVRYRAMYTDAIYAEAGSPSAPSLSVRDTATGVYSPATNQVGLVANNEYIYVDNSGANPVLRGDADSTWDLGTDAVRYANGYFDSIACPDLDNATSMTIAAADASTVLIGSGATDIAISGGLRLTEHTSAPPSGFTNNVVLFVESDLLKIVDENDDVTVLSPQGEGSAITGTTHTTDQDADQQPRDCSNASGCTITVNSAYAGCLLGPYFASTASQSVAFSNGTSTLVHLDATLSAASRGQNAKVWVLYFSATTHTLLGELATA